MEKIECYKPHMSWFLRFLKATVGRAIVKKYDIHIENAELLSQVTGPVVVLSNHTHIVDYMMIDAALPFYVRWVAGAHLFKNALVKFVVGGICHAISKEQGKSDLSTIQNMKKAIEAGDIVGVFPEGTRTWDGETIAQTSLVLAKMCRYMKAPVLVLNMQGSYNRKPRWATNEAEGPVYIHCRALLSAEEVASMRPDALEEKLDEYLSFNADDWLSEKQIEYRADDKTDGLQRVLYACPVCGSIGTNMIVRENEKKTVMRCEKCGCKTVVEPSGRLKSDAKEFDTVKKWHDWERGMLKEDGIRFAPEHGVLFQIGDTRSRKTISKDITVSADDESLTIKCNDNDKKTYTFAFKDTRTMAVSIKQTIEFFIGTTMYRFRIDPDSSSLKYSELHRAKEREQ